MNFVKPKRKVDKVFIHCSANDNEIFAGHRLYQFIREIHVDQNGWSDVGYHFLIDKVGQVMAGRSLEKIPAAQKGHNTGSIAIMVHGLEDFTGASMEALQKLCKQINEAYDCKLTFHGHCEVSDKACPVFDYKTVLQLDDEGNMSD